MRDTHFQGFAHLLQDELNNAWEYYARNLASISSEEYKQEIALILARRAYDLVKHSIECAYPDWLDAHDYDDIPERITDLTEWPPTEEA
jgi:hypothetical protein